MIGFLMLPFMFLLSIPSYLGFDALSATLLETFMGTLIAVVRFFSWGV